MKWIVFCISTFAVLVFLLSGNSSVEPLATVDLSPVEKQMTVRLQGPGERGNYFSVSHPDGIIGTCFDAQINGVHGFGKFINNGGKPYNLYVYFTRRHSPAGDRDKIAALKKDAVAHVDFRISKCTNGYFDQSKEISRFNGPVTVG